MDKYGHVCCGVHGSAVVAQRFVRTCSTLDGIIIRMLMRIGTRACVGVQRGNGVHSISSAAWDPGSPSR